MLAYNSQSLDNLAISEAAGQAISDRLLTTDEAIVIAQKHPVDLYRPNIFLRIGLFLLSAVIISMSCGFFMLLTNSARFEIMLPFFAIVSYVGLELFVRMRKHYHSGVDDALLWASMSFIFSALAINIHPDTELVLSLECLIVACFATIRFANAFMAGIMFMALLAVVFYAATSMTDNAKSVMPFVLAIISLAVYFFIKAIQPANTWRHYRRCMVVVEVLSLVMLYTSLNYFVVRETAKEMFKLHLAPGQSIPAGWFFWIATFVIPIVYLALGLIRKNTVLLRVGLLLIVAAILTYRNYYTIAPIEIIMSIGGTIMIALCYFVSKYFKTPKHSITIHTNNHPDIPGYLQLEGIAVAESFQPTADVQPHFQFGGGSTGGGGATGNW